MKLFDQYQLRTSPNTGAYAFERFVNFAEQVNTCALVHKASEAGRYDLLGLLLHLITFNRPKHLYLF